MTDGKCNGWSNYETWLVNLWHDQDPSFDEVKQDYCASCGTDLYALTNMIRDYTEEIISINCGVATACLAQDLLTASLSKVNYREIAESWLDEISLEDE